MRLTKTRWVETKISDVDSSDQMSTGLMSIQFVSGPKQVFSISYFSSSVVQPLDLESLIQSSLKRWCWDVRRISVGSNQSFVRLVTNELLLCSRGTFWSSCPGGVLMPPTCITVLIFSTALEKHSKFLKCSGLTDLPVFESWLTVNSVHLVEWFTV